MRLEVKAGGFSLVNESAHALVDLSRGGVSLDLLPPGSTWAGEDAPLKDLLGREVPLAVSARFPVRGWGAALADAQPGDLVWAALHLRTAGMPPSDLSPLGAPLGAPALAEEVVALRGVSAEVASSWLGDEPLRLALVAYAARHAPPGALLPGLFARVSPSAPPPPPSPGYERLPAAVDSLREAVEAHGADALSALLGSAAWAADRGFDDPLLALALGDEETLLLALAGRDPTAAARARAALEEDLRGGVAPLARAFIAAQRAAGADVPGRAVRLALAYARAGQTPEPGASSQALCGALDALAGRALNAKRPLAAQGYLSLAQPACQGAPYALARSAELMRARGDMGFFAGDYEGAQHWYRGALLLSDEPMNRVRLIDTLAQLSLRYLAQGEHKRARALLDEARGWDDVSLPPRELLKAADALQPRADGRARLGLILISAVLGVVALMQLLKALFGDLDARKRRPRPAAGEGGR
ncbi:MAG: hypothetical protein FJ138_17880 [Deltaproteobacteria bacterium]|nr:hypothetical protein [Deltaproteobacteria bacterium]